MARGSVRMTTELTGPFWTRGSQIKDATEEAESAAIKQGESDLRSYIGVKMKNPTGAYMASIKTEKRSNSQVLTDGGIVYGPWLEYGSRTRPTRFKGYTAFRRTRRKMRNFLKKAGEVAIARAVARLN